MKHLVTVKMPEREIGKADVEFEIQQSGKAFGASHAPKRLGGLVSLEQLLRVPAVQVGLRRVDGEARGAKGRSPPEDEVGWGSGRGRQGG